MAQIPLAELEAALERKAEMLDNGRSTCVVELVEPDLDDLPCDSVNRARTCSNYSECLKFTSSRLAKGIDPNLFIVRYFCFNCKLYKPKE